METITADDIRTAKDALQKLGALSSMELKDVMAKVCDKYFTDTSVKDYYMKNARSLKLTITTYWMR